MLFSCWKEYFCAYECLNCTLIFADGLVFSQSTFGCWLPFFFRAAADIYTAMITKKNNLHSILCCCCVPRHFTADRLLIDSFELNWLCLILRARYPPHTLWAMTSIKICDKKMVKFNRYGWLFSICFFPSTKPCYTSQMCSSFFQYSLTHLTVALVTISSGELIHIWCSSEYLW